MNMNEVASKLNGYYFLDKDGKEDRTICQYMRLDYLIQLLETQKYYVKRRKYFDDLNERYQNTKLAFAPVLVRNNDVSNVDSPKRKIPYMKIVNCPTSCWTMCERESFLMWKSYATEMGACIRTSVHRFIDSLLPDFSLNSTNRIVAGSMIYDKVKPSFDEIHQLFDKDYVYADEQEFRFYFYLADDDGKETRGICLPVNTSGMIEEILLSPFINKEAADSLAQMIENAYHINVNPSSIKL